MPRKSFPKRVDTKSLVESKQSGDFKPEKIDVMKILADPHPKEGADYAIHLWYKSHGHNPRFQVQEKSFNTEDMETATLLIEGNRWAINIRTAEIKKI